MENIEKNVPTKKTFFGQLLEYIIAIIIAVIAGMLIRNYVFARADVVGQSMEATLSEKDVLFVEKISTLTGNIKRGQIIIFDSHDQQDDIYVKRVIGIEGDLVEIKGGKVYLNGEALKEDYLKPETITNVKPGGYSKVTVQKGQVYVLGDNREHSKDSREIGPINIKDIKGHTILRVYPFSKFKIF